MIAPSVLPGTHDPHLTALMNAALEKSGLREIGRAVLIDLRTGTFGACRADENVYPASLVKVSIMVEAFARFADGSLDPGAPIVIDAANMTTTWGVSPYAPGVVAAVGELVSRMITHSDNVATNQLFDVLGRERVTQAMRALGLPTFLLGRKLSGSEPLIDDPAMVGRNRLPPEEIARLLALIATDAVPGAAAQRDILARCVHREKLACGLRGDDRFAHKTGETEETSHDAGILETADGRRFVVVLYTTPAPRPDSRDASQVDAAMTAWMREVREGL